MSSINIVKIVAAILSILLAVFVIYESAFSTETINYIGVIFALMVLLAGIVAILTLNVKEGALITGTIFISASLIGIIMHYDYINLIIYGAVALILGLFFSTMSIFMPEEY